MQTKAKAGRKEARGSIIVRELKSGNVSYSMRFRPAKGADKRCDLIGYASEGMTREAAEEHLTVTLAAVRAGTWVAPEQLQAEQAAKEKAAAEAVVPTFAEYVEKWLKRRKARPSKPRGEEARAWSLGHLLPWFGEIRTDEITVDDVDNYAEAKLEEGLGGSSVNRTLSLLAAILNYAAERKAHHCPVNPAAGHDRRVPTKPVKRIALDAEQTGALLGAAKQLDAECRQGRRYRAPLLATLCYAGTRIGEALELRWQDVDLGAGKIEIRESKTEAGKRTIDLQPELRDFLVTWKMEARYSAPEAYVFPTFNGTKDYRSSVRKNVLLRSVERANQRIAEHGGCEPIPAGLKLHDCRVTYCSWLFTERCTLPYVRSQMGHTSSKMTMQYAQMIEAKGGRVVEAGGRPVALLPEWATMDTETVPAVETPVAA